MHSIPEPFLRAVEDATGLGWQGSLALLDLYGAIECSIRNGRQPSIASLARDRGTKQEMIRSKALVLAELGWLSFATEGGVGTVWTLKGIPAELTHV